MVPHPPMIVPCVGRGGEKQIEATAAAYRRVAADIAAFARHVSDCHNLDGKVWFKLKEELKTKAETEVVAAAAWRVVVAKRYSTAPGIVSTTATTTNANGARRQVARILAWRVLVVSAIIQIKTPFPNISGHVI